MEGAVAEDPDGVPTFLSASMPRTGDDLVVGVPVDELLVGGPLDGRKTDTVSQPSR